MIQPRCPKRSPQLRVRCHLVEGHKGAHQGPFDKDKLCSWLNASDPVTGHQDPDSGWSEAGEPTRPGGGE